MDIGTELSIKSIPLKGVYYIFAMGSFWASVPKKWEEGHFSEHGLGTTSILKLGGPFLEISGPPLDKTVYSLAREKKVPSMNF